MTLDAVQLGHARTIRDVTQAMRLPVRALVIALETALDESGIRVLANANNPASLRLPHDGIGQDHASVGIFQQQPGDAPGSTVNWGTTHDCMDPALSAGKFLRALQGHAWQTMTNWAAAQAVQVSAYPDGSNYRRYDQQATELAAQLWGETMALTDEDARTLWTHDLADGPGVAPAYKVIVNTQAAVAQLVAGQAATNAKLDQLIAAVAKTGAAPPPKA